MVLASRAGDLEIVQGIVALGAEIDLPTNVSSLPLKRNLTVPPKPIGAYIH